MKLHDLYPTPGSTHTTKRRHRGIGSGKGKTGGKGMNGQKSRAGSGPYRTFEGGQNRLVKRMPFKRGFVNIWRVEYEIINVAALADLEIDGPITLDSLRELGIYQSTKKPMKVLGDGELSKALVVHAHKFSESARTKIEAAGGSVVEVPWDEPRRSRSRGINPSIPKNQA